MILLIFISSRSIGSLILNYASFLRVLLLLEVLLLVTGFYLSLSLDVIAGVSAFSLFTSLVALLLAGTEAAIGVTLVLYFYLYHSSPLIGISGSALRRAFLRSNRVKGYYMGI